jgi:hypothetical protein
MTSKPKLWILGDENEATKLYRYEDQENPEIWMEIQFDKGTEHFTLTRNNFNTPGKWHRFEEPIRNYQIAKRKAFEYLMRRTLALRRVA